MADAVIVPRGAGERIAQTTEIKGAHEQVVVVEFTYPSGKSGPNPHIHREHADCFFILDGELTFLLGPDGDPRRAGPGTFALVPPGVVHTFRNDYEGETRFVNIHAPGKAFDGYLRANRDGRDFDFDSFDPPEDGGRPLSDALVVEPGGGEEIALGPSTITIKAGQEHEPGGLAFSESSVGAGFPGPVPHTHERMVDSFFVLEGTLTLQLADGSTEIGPGTYGLVPPGTVHTFSNPGDEPVSVLNIMAPAGLENYFREMKASLAADGPPDPEAMARIASKYDFKPATP